MNLIEKFQFLPLLLPAIILSLTLHELAHGVVANWLGDPTAKREGRLTLNPIKHLDPLGSVTFMMTFLVFAFPFGWAKPIPVVHRNLKKPQRDFALVAIAGPLTNILIAFVMIFVIRAFGNPDAAIQTHFLPDGIRFTGDYLSDVMLLTLNINVVLAVFNMIPIPPLDGSRVVGIFMNRSTYEAWLEFDAKGWVVLLLILIVAQKESLLVIQGAVDFVYKVMALVPGV